MISARTKYERIALSDYINTGSCKIGQIYNPLTFTHIWEYCHFRSSLAGTHKCKMDYSKHTVCACACACARACACERVRKPFPAISRHMLYPLHSWAPQLWLTLPTSAEIHLPTSGFSPLPLKKLVLKSLQRVVIFPLWRLAQLEKVSFCTQSSLKAFVDKSNRQRCV